MPLSKKRHRSAITQSWSKRLNIDKCVDVVAFGEAFYQPGSVFPDSFLDIAGEPDIQRARLVCHDVDIVGFVSWHAVIISAITLRNQFPPLRERPRRPSGRNDKSLLSYRAERSRDIWLRTMVAPYSIPVSPNWPFGPQSE